MKIQNNSDTNTEPWGTPIVYARKAIIYLDWHSSFTDKTTQFSLKLDNSPIILPKMVLRPVQLCQYIKVNGIATGVSSSYQFTWFSDILNIINLRIILSSNFGVCFIFYSFWMNKPPEKHYNSLSNLSNLGGFAIFPITVEEIAGAQEFEKISSHYSVNSNGWTIFHRLYIPHFPI